MTMLSYAVSYKIEYEELPNISAYEFQFNLSRSIARNLPDSDHLLMEHDVIQFGENIIRELIDRRLIHNTRIESRICNEIFEKYRQDPCIQTITERFILDDTYRFSPLIGIGRNHHTITVYFSLHG